MDDNFDNWSDCFLCGMWIPGLPFISCCVNPYCCIVTFIEDGDLDEGSYCPRDLGVCNNKLRDEYFYHRHKWETDTDYYPESMSDEERYDRRITKLTAVVAKSVKHLSGEKTVFVDIYSAHDAFEDMVVAIREARYSITKRRFYMIVNQVLDKYNVPQSHNHRLRSGATRANF